MFIGSFQSNNSDSRLLSFLCICETNEVNVGTAVFKNWKVKILDSSIEYMATFDNFTPMFCGVVSEKKQSRATIHSTELFRFSHVHIVASSTLSHTSNTEGTLLMCVGFMLLSNKDKLQPLLDKSVANIPRTISDSLYRFRRITRDRSGVCSASL